ncbi:ArsR/SmtB family transcription factor [Prosthecomicrobium sp. N25]|uniref:ArsR/SmtB family transcription factor n=1 Tax=Prosthecomicrobium sp. N25 TaxID=3129254 RepID=UPI00307894A4
MRNGPDIAGLAALIGDPARATILEALMSGLALTAGELAREAGVSPQTATAHLSKLRDAGLIVMAVQGRHRYYRLAGQDVAGAIEGLMGLSARLGRLRTRPGPRDAAMRMARVCYDHLAGELGVRMHDAFVERGLLGAGPEGLHLTEDGRRAFRAEGLDVAAASPKGRPLCRSCLDWSMRRPHLAGVLGADLLQAILSRGWASRDPASRAIRFTPQGLERFEAFLAGSPAVPAALPAPLSARRAPSSR